MKFIDLRSDTVTLPTPEMRQAMFDADLGDDVYGDDPTVNELQTVAAAMLGKEAALFVPSGTMGNQLAVLSHTSRGQEIILSDESHIALHEGGGAALLSGVMTRSLHFPDGRPVPAQIRAAIREHGNVHFPHTGLIALEQPLAIGKLVPLSTLGEIYTMAREQGIPVHFDGARIFNAAVAMGVEVTEITQHCDSVMACLSKGLCSPVGSVLAGSREFIDIAIRYRKILGGGMRQAGVLAAAGLISLRQMVARLSEDHSNAKYMAEQLQKLPDISIDPATVEINMVFFAIHRPTAWISALPAAMMEVGIKINECEDGMFRFVTSNEVTREDIDYTIAYLSRLMH